jgi:hypothetical protein
MKKQAKAQKQSAMEKKIGEREIPICPSCGLVLRSNEFLPVRMEGMMVLSGWYDCSRCGASGFPLMVKAKDYAKMKFQWKGKESKKQK